MGKNPNRESIFVINASPKRKHAYIIVLRLSGDSAKINAANILSKVAGISPNSTYQFTKCLPAVIL